MKHVYDMILVWIDKLRWQEQGFSLDEALGMGKVDKIHFSMDLQ